MHDDDGFHDVTAHEVVARNIRIGALVMLRSGGPPMTVLTWEGDGVVECGWFDQAILLTWIFPVRCLRAEGE